ncbi:hypothetical protein NL676_024452 [Syzygium grande]|nr:hypothetical protein NL676_024452 [Syzygium grande]
MRSLRLARNNSSSEHERLVCEGWILYDTGNREEALLRAEKSITIQRSFEAFFLKAYVLADTSLDSEASSYVIRLLEEALGCPSDGLRKGQPGVSIQIIEMMVSSCSDHHHNSALSDLPTLKAEAGSVHHHSKKHCPPSSSFLEVRPRVPTAKLLSDTQQVVPIPTSNPWTLDYIVGAFKPASVGSHLGIARAGVVVARSFQGHAVAASTASPACSLTQAWPRQQLAPSSTSSVTIVRCMG